MTKHGRNKKARSASRNNKAMKSSFANAKFKNPNALFRTALPVVKESWDPKVSPVQNLANMGLKTNMNDDITAARRVKSDDIAKKGASLELFDIPSDGSAIKGHTKRDVLLPVSVDDQQYIVKLLSKHKLNYMKMFRDTKLNNMQHTAVKLERMADKFFDLTEAQRVVDTPKAVLELVK
jgi:hypothetical protein